MANFTLTEEVVARFWSKVLKGGPDDCWIWTGWKNTFGHGRLDIGKAKVLAHQLALILDGQPRPAPPRDNALHGDCSNPSCVNPRHLRWGTKRENTEDRDRLKRRVRVPRGTLNFNCKLTDEAVRFILTSPRSQRSVAREFGVTQATISAIRRRKTWAHITP